MRIGVDSYAFHRFLGELRPGESAPAERWDDPLGDPTAAALALGLEAVSLQRDTSARNSGFDGQNRLRLCVHYGSV